MSRQAVKESKRVLTQGQRQGATAASLGLAQEASLHLLERSISFGHTRLSVLRLAMAARTGAMIPSACWDFCHRIAVSSKDMHTQALFLEALQSAGSSATPAGHHATFQPH